MQGEAGIGESGQCQREETVGNWAKGSSGVGVERGSSGVGGEIVFASFAQGLCSAELTRSGSVTLRRAQRPCSRHTTSQATTRRPQILRRIHTEIPISCILR